MQNKNYYSLSNEVINMELQKKYVFIQIPTPPPPHAKT